jgi:hypothetical protein
MSPYTRKQLLSGAIALGVVLVIVVILGRHFLFLASMTNQGFLGLTPADTRHRYFIQALLESAALLAVGIFAYRRILRALTKG